jgi:hypothetical protein
VTGWEHEPRLICRKQTERILWAKVYAQRLPTSWREALVRARDERLLHQGFLDDQILEAVKAKPDCTLDELIFRVSGASWSEVFFEVDRLSRAGQFRLTKSRSGLTTTLRAL